MESINTHSNAGFQEGSRDIRPLLHHLEAEGLEVLNLDKGHVRCPGEDLHTRHTSPTACTVWNNEGVPRLMCFHQSCDEIIQACNRSLWSRAVREGGNQGHSLSLQPVQEPPTQADASDMIQQIVGNFWWSYQDILNDSAGKIEDPPETHYQHLISLFEPEDVLWIGRDVYDTGRPKSRWRFRTADEWMAKPDCPGVFICPNTFKPGVTSRSDANVAKLRFLVVESDILTKDEVGAIFKWMVALGCNLRAVVDTAGKSIHGWFHYPDPERLEHLRQVLPLLQCDISMLKPSQPVRLPGALRNGNYQRLIYFKHQQDHSNE